MFWSSGDGLRGNCTCWMRGHGLRENRGCVSASPSWAHTERFRQEGEVANVKKGPQRVFVGFQPRLRSRALEKFSLWRCLISMSTEIALATSGRLNIKGLDTYNICPNLEM